MLQKPEPIKKVFKRTLKKLGISKRLKETDAVRIFSEAVGEQIAAHAEATRIAGGKLFVRVSSPVWRQQLTYQKEKIINSINQELGEKIVSDIYFSG